MRLVHSRLRIEAVIVLRYTVAACSSQSRQRGVPNDVHRETFPVRGSGSCDNNSAKVAGALGLLDVGSVCTERHYAFGS